MDTRNCKMCGKLFTYIRSPFCTNCGKELEEKFKQVKNYIYEHPSAGIEEVSEANEVSQHVIRYWIKDERLGFTENSATNLVCEKCGVPILTGRYCRKCKSEVQKKLQQVYAVDAVSHKVQKNNLAKMRFLDRNNSW